SLSPRTFVSSAVSAPPPTGDDNGHSDTPNERYDAGMATRRDTRGATMITAAPAPPATHAVDDLRWQAVVERRRDLRALFVVAVRTTGIYCRPGCPARTPRRENVEFFAATAAARDAGYRPCLRCLPDS